MGSYPWGPHGPQAGPNEVTPNPTPAWVPPPAASGGSWAPPAASYGGGAAPTYNAGYSGAYVPRKKSYLLAAVLTVLFGPLGLIYVTFRGMLLMVTLMLSTPYTLAKLGAYGPAFRRAPIEIIGRDAVMNRWWALAAMISFVWALIGVRRRNRNAS